MQLVLRNNREDQIQITLDQLRWHRLIRSGLIFPFASAEECAEALIGIQAQMSHAAALAIANRVEQFSFIDFENKLYNQRSLVRTWGQRDTLHVYRSSDWPKLIAVLRHRRSWAYTKFRNAGGSDAEYENFLAKIDGLLINGGAYTRDDISNRTGIEASAWGGLLIDAAYRGFISDAGYRHFSHGIRWSSNSADLEEYEKMCLDLVQRYLRSYGPAEARDIAYWFKDKVGTINKFLNKIDLVEVLCEGRRLYALKEDREILSSLNPPSSVNKWPIIMLYRFDPMLLAHKNKGWIVPSKFYNDVWTSGGHVSGVILQKGVAVASWSYKKIGNKYGINMTALSKIRSPKRMKSKIKVHETFLNNFFEKIPRV